MEEYAYLLGIQVCDKVPFCGLEGVLGSQVIAEAIHLRKSDVDVNFLLSKEVSEG